MALAILALGWPAAGTALVDQLPAPATQAASPESSAESLWTHGLERLRSGRTNEAEALFERALQLDPSSPAARDLGLLRGRQGRLEAAYPPLLSWARAHPEDIEARLAAAACAVELRRASEAEELVGDLPPEQPPLRVLHARLALLQGSPERAAELLDRDSIAQAPPPIALDMRRIAAQAHLMLGHAANAVELLDGYQGNDPSLALQLARALYLAGLAQRSAEVLRPIIEALPLRSAATSADRALFSALRLSYGRVLLEQRKAAEAVPQLELAVQLNPTDRESWQLYGRALILAGRRDEGMAALERFRSLVEIEGGDLQRRNRVESQATDPTGRSIAHALELAEAGQVEQALEILDSEAQVAQDDPRPALFAGRLLLRLGRLEEAAAAAQALALRFPDSADVLQFRAAGRRAAGEEKAAEADLRRALELAPDHAAAMSDLADLLAHQGRDDEARRWRTRLREIDPDHGAGGDLREP